VSLISVAAAVVLLASNAADTPAPPEADPVVVATPPPAPSPATPSVATEKKTKEKSPLEVTGRVYARETFAPAGLDPRPDDPWTGRFSLASARVGAKYRVDDLLLDIDAELEGKPKLKDAYIRLDTGYFGTAIRAGQFKAPFAALALESTWKLPTIDRGVLDVLLIDRLQIGGRRPGAQVEWNGNGEWLPLFEMGIWRGTDQEGEPREDSTSEVIGETAGARASLRPGPMQIGLSGAWRAAQPLPGMEFERFWAAGADLSIDTDAGFRSWVEGGTGSSWADADPADDDHAVFAYARTVAAWRLGGHGRGDPYVEAFGASGALDPGIEIRHDLVWENAVGLNVGRWKRWRGQLQFESSRTSRNTPVSLLAETPKDARAVLLQIGVSL
jgi:hypothetical protein